MPPSLDTLFNIFWDAYPRHQRMIAAHREFCLMEPPPDEVLVAKMIATIEAAKKAGAWDNPKYIPMAENWLKEKRWLDEYPDPTDDWRDQLDKMYG